MNTQRDELAVILEDEQENGKWPSTPDADLYGCMADAILAAGYSKPRVIETIEELDTLPNGSYIMDAEPDIMAKYDGMWRSPNYPGDAFPAQAVAVPATVLYEARR